MTEVLFQITNTMHLIERVLLLSTILVADEAFLVRVPLTHPPLRTYCCYSLSALLSNNGNSNEGNKSNNNNNKSSVALPSILATWQHKAATTIATGLLCGGAALNALLFVLPPPPAAHAAEALSLSSSRVVGQIAGSGIVFKDTLQVESFADPKVRGVTLYISNFQRPITERFSSAKNFFSDPSSAAVACARTSKNKIEIADNINKSPQGEEVFQESKSLLFKSLRVQRIYDEETNTVVYVSFNTRLDKNEDDNKSRFQNSLCAVNLN